MLPSQRHFLVARELHAENSTVSMLSRACVESFAAHRSTAPCRCTKWHGPNTAITLRYDYHFSPKHILSSTVPVSSAVLEVLSMPVSKRFFRPGPLWHKTGGLLRSPHHGPREISRRCREGVASALRLKVFLSAFLKRRACPCRKTP